jgi:hypothetical protein
MQNNYVDALILCTRLNFVNYQFSLLCYNLANCSFRYGLNTSFFLCL